MRAMTREPSFSSKRLLLLWLSTALLLSLLWIAPEEMAFSIRLIALAAFGLQPLLLLLQKRPPNWLLASLFLFVALAIVTTALLQPWPFSLFVPLALSSTATSLFLSCLAITPDQGQRHPVAQETEMHFVRKKLLALDGSSWPVPKPIALGQVRQLHQSFNEAKERSALSEAEKAALAQSLAAQQALSLLQQEQLAQLEASLVVERSRYEQLESDCRALEMCYRDMSAQWHKLLEAQQTAEREESHSLPLASASKE